MTSFGLAVTADATTLIVSALVSAVVATVVSVSFAFVLGGALEVRKQRALRREAARSELLERLGLQLNAVAVLRSAQRGWSTTDGVVTEFTDIFDEGFARIEADYQSSLRHFAGNEDEPELTSGWAMQTAGTHLARVRHFRNEAVGQPPDALHAERIAMHEDLSTAYDLLVEAREVLRGGRVRRRWKLRSLKKRLDELRVLDEQGQAPKTPLNYFVALQAAKARQHEHGPGETR